MAVQANSCCFVLMAAEPNANSEECPVQCWVPAGTTNGLSHFFTMEGGSKKVRCSTNTKHRSPPDGHKVGTVVHLRPGAHPGFLSHPQGLVSAQGVQCHTAIRRAACTPRKERARCSEGSQAPLCGARWAVKTGAARAHPPQRGPQGTREPCSPEGRTSSPLRARAELGPVL